LAINKVVVRKAQLDDSKKISEISGRLFKQTYEGKMPSEDLDVYITEEFKQELKIEELKDSSITTFIAETEGKAIGYAQIRKKQMPFTSDNSCELELWRIYLDSLYQRIGIGNLLLGKVSEVARDLSSDYIWLGVWDQNTQAISFYEKNGFSVVGNQQFEVGSDIQNDLVMVGSLSAF
jgi:ribosomal protein S18 acetylase RimI-like enzyme